ncbi:MAG: fimbrillin family protein [Prevotellaceae bacterium]|nr:fimbrillin family protein [Prevotellaceae bacterium]
MKRNYLLTGALLLAISSCTNEVNEEGFVDKANCISFNAYPNKIRAVTEDVTTSNMKGDNFGVVGYKSDNNIYLYKNTNKAVEQKWVSSTNTWEYKDMGDLKFWPEGEMDFYAYFPFSDNATFAESDASGDVMTIATTCAHDVLFAKATSGKSPRVPLTFYHAFSKIKGLQIEMPSEGTLFKSKCQVEVQKVEFINTSTSGEIKVDNAGIASYTVASKNVTFKEDLTSSPVTINSTVDDYGTPTDNIKYLINKGTNANGYLFATNSDETNGVKGTGKTMWDGQKTSIPGPSGTLSGSNLVCLKLTCKVWNGADDKKYYYVGGASSYDDIYIPLTGLISDNGSINTFDAGKRYTYKIVMKDNVGYTDQGDAILTPILFEVESVKDWDDVTITITL